MNKLAAEFFATFTLVFAGTGAIVINDVSGGAVPHIGVALTFGLVVLAMIYTVGDISGAHLNPAVTLGFFAAGRCGLKTVPGYIASQLLGATAASLLLRFLFPENATLGITMPAGSVPQSLILEAVLTFILMWVILSVSTGAKEKGITAGIAVGSVIGLEAMFAGPDLRRVDESRPLVWTRAGFDALPTSLDLPGCSCPGRVARSSGLPADLSGRMLRIVIFCAGRTRSE